MDENELKGVVAKNISRYRKIANLTQLELAEKLNYSDKAVSKWERAESLPDIFVLNQIAQLFKIHLDDLISDNDGKKIYIGFSIEKRIFFPVMICSLIFLVATLAFAIFQMLEVNIERKWLCFIFAFPACALTLFIFSLAWRHYLLITISTSLFMWCTALSLYLVITAPNNFMIFIIVIPAQALMITWYVLKQVSQRKKKKF